MGHQHADEMVSAQSLGLRTMTSQALKASPTKYGTWHGCFGSVASEAMRAHSDDVEVSLAKGRPCTATPRVMRTMIYPTRSPLTIPATAIPMNSE